MTDPNNPTGIGDLGSFILRDPVQLDNTQVSWSTYQTDVVATGPNAEQYSFTLLGSLSAPGILLTTEQDFIAFYKAQKFPSSSKQMTLVLNGKVTTLDATSQSVGFAAMTAPWILCQWPDEPQSVPVLLVMSHKPVGIHWQHEQIGF